MLLSLYSLLLRAVFQPLSTHMGAPQMPRYARMAVPLASLLLACAGWRSYARSFRSNELRAARPSIVTRKKRIFPQQAGWRLRICLAVTF
jgi:hypothetical protein